MIQFQKSYLTYRVAGPKQASPSLYISSYLFRKDQTLDLSTNKLGQSSIVLIQVPAAVQIVSYHFIKGEGEIGGHT